MKSTTAILTVKLLGDNQTGKAFKEAQSQAQKLEQGLDKAAGVATGALVGLAAAGTGAALAAEAVATANSTVSNILGNMGMDKATDRVLDYADALEKSLGIDEKVIKTTQGKLGTFSELAATADVAGGAFDRATLAALDMAAAGFGSAEQNAVQLGKALQDPIKGVTALQRSGVTFTQSQRDMIEAMVEAGDMAGAQNLILSELEKQVGGTAEATADSSAKLKLSFGEVAEQLGTALLPMLDTLAEWAGKFAAWAGENTGLLMTIAGIVAGIAAAVVAVNAALKIYNAVTTITTAVTWLMNTALLANPITWVVIAVVAFIAALVLLWNKCDGFRNAVTKLWNILKGAFLGALNAVKGALSRVWEWVKRVGDFIAGTFRAAWDGLRGAIDWVSGAIGTVIGWLRSALGWVQKVGRAMGDFLSNLNPFKGLFGGRSARIVVGGTVGYAAAPRPGAATTINVRAAGYNPQREARELARLLTGARVRTGFRGVRAA